MNEIRLESLEKSIKQLKRKNRRLGIIIAFLVLLILGLVLFICLYKASEVICISPETEEPKPNIVVNTELVTELRKLIPTVSKCETYYYEQYSDNTYDNEKEIKEFEDCKDYMTVSYLYDSSTSSPDEVYIVDYILIKNNNAKDENEVYGNTFDKIVFPSKEIVHDGIIPSDIFLRYGMRYKYTFKLNEDGTYSYVKTEKLKEEN